jgi:hypothetical protein
MSSLPAAAPPRWEGSHPVVAARRRRELLNTTATALAALVVGLVLSIEIKNGSVALVLLVAVGLVGLGALVTYPRLQVTVTVAALYLGLLEGPVKLGFGGHELTSVMRDVVIFGAALGAILRILARRESVRLPPLSAWVLAWWALVLVEAFNPKTHGITKALGGFRQQLEWTPFFFFGYALIRSKARLRKMFLIIGVIALANGIVGTYQTGLQPTQLAAWGPGYKELVFGTPGGLGARVFAVEGEGRVRPPGLGTDAGGAGGWGVVALPGILALLAYGRLRRRWPVLLLCFGALAGVATGEGRIQVVGAVLAVLAFLLLSMSAGRQVLRPVLVLLGVLVLVIPLGAVFVSAVGSRTFSRLSSLEELSTGSKDTKTGEIKKIPAAIEKAPFGYGLGTAGAATGFGGVAVSESIEKASTGAETEYNFVTEELGLPGLILWVALTIRLLTLALPAVGRVRDVETRLYLAAIFAVLIAMTIIGFSGPTMGSSAFGPFFWTTAGIAAYWFAGPGRDRRPAPALGRLAAGAPA